MVTLHCKSWEGLFGKMGLSLPWAEFPGGQGWVGDNFV